jgi:hypothetical protein
MAYLTQTGRSVWTSKQSGQEKKMTRAIEIAINEGRSFTMLRHFYNPRHVSYNWPVCWLKNAAA